MGIKIKRTHQQPQPISLLDKKIDDIKNNPYIKDGCKAEIINQYLIDIGKI